MSNNEAQKLENTNISNEDARQLKEENDTKLDNTSSTSKKSGSSSRKGTKSPKSKGQKAPGVTAGSDVSDNSLFEIKSSLSDPVVAEDFIANVTDSISQYSRRKLTEEEAGVIRKAVKNSIFKEVFQIKSLD